VASQHRFLLQLIRIISDLEMNGKTKQSLIVAVLYPVHSFYPLNSEIVCPVMMVKPD
jgi:hypothetical protein